MTAKMAAGKVEAFLAALAETGNASLAAKQAGLSRSWVTKARWVDAALDAQVRAARAEAAGRLAACEANRPPEAWAMRKGAALVVTRRGQIARAPGRRRWTRHKEEHFLLALRKTRNLGVAAQAVGMSIASLEKHMARWPAFRERVSRALRISAPRLAMLLIAYDGGAEPPEMPDLAWPAGMDAGTLIRTLRRNKPLLGRLSAEADAQAAAEAAAAEQACEDAGGEATAGAGTGPDGADACRPRCTRRPLPL